MGNFLENVIEKMIGEGIITESELQARIEAEKEKSPFLPLQAENAELLFRNAAQEVVIKTLQDENADVLFRLAELEKGGM